MTAALQSSFLDHNGDAVVIPAGATDEFMRPWHLDKNRSIHKTACFCDTCGGPVHPVRLAEGIWMVRHNPGHGNGACEYTDVWEQIGSSDREKSPHHQIAQTRLTIALRSLTGYQVEPEKRFTDGLRFGDSVFVDVWAKGTDGEFMHEIQLSKQGDDVTVTRSEQRRQVSTGAIVPWWVSNPTDLGPELGWVVDDRGTRLAGRCFRDLDMTDPDYPTIGEAARRTHRKSNKWVLQLARLPELDFNVGYVFWPQSVGSAAPAVVAPKPRQIVAIRQEACQRPIPANAAERHRLPAPVPDQPRHIETYADARAFLTRPGRHSCPTCDRVLELFNERNP